MMRCVPPLIRVEGVDRAVLAAVTSRNQLARHHHDPASVVAQVEPRLVPNRVMRTASPREIHVRSARVSALCGQQGSRRQCKNAARRAATFPAENNKQKDDVTIGAGGNLPPPEPVWRVKSSSRISPS
jgi:hypothetical protein